MVSIPSSIRDNHKRGQVRAFLMSQARLFRLSKEIDARIELVLLEKSNDKSGFLEEILKTEVIIYDAEQG